MGASVSFQGLYLNDYKIPDVLYCDSALSTISREEKMSEQQLLLLCFPWLLLLQNLARFVQRGGVSYVLALCLKKEGL